MEIYFVWCREGTTRVNEVDVDWEEDCQVTAEFSGCFRPAKLYPIEESHPAEYPELEITIVTDSQGNDITEILSAKEMSIIEGMAWDLYDLEKESDMCNEDDAYERAEQDKLDNGELQ